jgi:hypothetical protein
LSRSYHNSPSFHSCESNKLTENDYCIRRTNCYKKVFLDIGYITINKKRKIKKDCKCDSKHSFKCGEYCTINNKYCDVLNLRIKYQKKMNKSGVKICPSYWKKLLKSITLFIFHLIYHIENNNYKIKFSSIINFFYFIQSCLKNWLRYSKLSEKSRSVLKTILWLAV